MPIKSKPSIQTTTPNTDKDTTMTTTARKPASSGGFWDDPDLKPESGGFFKFDNVGDGISGTIRKLGKHVFQDGSIAIQITFTDDELPTLSAGQYLLKAALYELKPLAGDDLSVELTRIEKLGTKTFKHFTTTLTRASDGSTETVEN